jgi:3'-5' exoribonuclease
MTAKRRNEPINAWEDGDSISGFALMSRKERRMDRNGREFLDLELTDATASITAKAWSDSQALDGDYDAHAFVAFRGNVKMYKDRLQVSVTDCRRVTEGDREHGFDESNLIPSTPEDIGELWARIKYIYGHEISNPFLQRLAAETLAVSGPDLKEHPAAKAIHHAYRGGLLEHTVSMAEVALRLCELYDELDRDLVLLGVLFHDLGKLIEIGAMPVNEYTPPGRLVGHVVMGRDLLRERCDHIEGFPDRLRLHLEHLILSHQGRLEYGSPVTPMTAEAITLHFIDNLDSKLAQLRDATRAGGSGFQWVRGLDRFVYLGEAASEAEGDDESAEAPAQAHLEL